MGQSEGTDLSKWGGVIMLLRSPRWDCHPMLTWTRTPPIDATDPSYALGPSSCVLPNAGRRTAA